MKKRFNAVLYTQGRFGKEIRQTLDTDSEFLYSMGIYPTKIRAEELPEDYVKIRSRSIWYMTGWLKTSGIKDMKYSWARFNHVFKDDYLHISYDKPIEPKKDDFGTTYCNAEISICGSDIVPLVLAAERNSGFDTTEVRAEIEKKRRWLIENGYSPCDGIDLEQTDVFEHWQMIHRG